MTSLNQTLRKGTQKQKNDMILSLCKVGTSKSLPESVNNIHW